MERLFQLQARGTTVGTELRGGAVTFVTMSYIIFVQPGVLSANAGMDFGAVMAATCLAAALATLVMGLWANLPIAQAPLMGENFFFAISVVTLMHVPWPTALGIVCYSGLLFLLLTVLRVREMVLDAVPDSLRAAIVAGIGLFIAFIGLTEAGLVTKSPAPAAFVQLGQLGSPVALVSLAGLAITSVLLARRVRGGILVGMALSTGLAWAAGLVHFHGLVAAPPSLAPTFGRLDLAGALAYPGLIAVFLFMLVFDTIGTLIGVSEQAGLMRDGRLPNANRAMLADALGTVAGAVLGTSTVSSYLESASGVADGARTGLASCFTALLFLAALFFSPLAAMIGGGVKVNEIYYYPITAPVIVLVGSFMMGHLARVRWDDPTEAIPAFLTLVMIPFTFNIAHGVAWGLIAYVLIKAGAGRFADVSRLMWVLAAALIVGYAVLPGLNH